MRIAGQFLCLRHHLGNAGLLAQNNLVFIFAIVKSSFLFIIHRQSLQSKVYNCRVFHSLSMPSLGSGGLTTYLTSPRSHWTSQICRIWQEKELRLQDYLQNNNPHLSQTRVRLLTLLKVREKLCFSTNLTYWQASCKTWYLLWKLYKRLTMPRYCKMSLWIASPGPSLHLEHVFAGLCMASISCNKNGGVVVQRCGMFIHIS